MPGPPAIAVSLCFFSFPFIPAFPDLGLHTHFNVYRLHLFPTFAKNESCRVLFFSIVFIAFGCFLGGQGDNSDLHSHVYAWRSNWHFKNYLISIALKNIIMNLDCRSLVWNIISHEKSIYLKLIVKFLAREAYTLPLFTGNVQKELS